METVFIIGGLILFLVILVVVIPSIFFRKDVETSLKNRIKEERGKKGEKRVNDALATIIKDDEYILTNLLIPTSGESKTEIDTVLVSRKGIFCIETKNWVGHIRGDEYGDYWIQRFDDPSLKDCKHRNPYLQNEKHCSILDRTLNNRYDVNNVIILCGYETKTGIYSLHTYSIIEFISFYNMLPDKELYIEDVENIVKSLMKFEASEEELNEHKLYVEAKYKHRKD